MAAADGRDPNREEFYANIGNAAAKGDLDAVLSGRDEADEKEFAHAMRKAAQHSQVHVLERLIPCLSSPDLVGQSGYTALHFAIWNDANIETIEMLIGADACPWRKASTKKRAQREDAFQQLNRAQSSQSKREAIQAIMRRHACHEKCIEDNKQGYLVCCPTAPDVELLALGYDAAQTSSTISPMRMEAEEQLPGLWAERHVDDDELPETKDDVELPKPTNKMARRRY